jgi:hypothetical protein
VACFPPNARTPGRPRALGAVLYILYILSIPAQAHADAGETLLGLAVQGELAPTAGIDAVAQFGVNDMVALRGWLGGRYGETATDAKGATLDVGVGIVCAWDVLSLVPELTLGGGLRSTTSKTVAESLATMGIRRFLSPDVSLSLAGGGGWRTDGKAYGMAQIGLWRRLP